MPGAFEDFAFAGVGDAGEAVGKDEGAEKLAGLDSVAVKKLGKGKVREGEF